MRAAARTPPHIRLLAALPPYVRYETLAVERIFQDGASAEMLDRLNTNQLVMTQELIANMLLHRVVRTDGTMILPRLGRTSRNLDG